jgi:hypothetical protein
LLVKKHGKFVSFTIKERQRLPVVNRYLIIFNIYSVFLIGKTALNSGKIESHFTVGGSSRLGTCFGREPGCGSCHHETGPP